MRFQWKHQRIGAGRSLDGDAFGEVPRLVDRPVFRVGNVVREQLQRNVRHNGFQRATLRDVERRVDVTRYAGVAGDANDGCAAGLGFFYIVDGFRGLSRR